MQNKRKNDNIKNNLTKRPKCGKMKNLSKMSCSIGKLFRVHYKTMLKKYEYHSMLLCLLGKHECKKLEDKLY